MQKNFKWTGLGILLFLLASTAYSQANDPTDGVHITIIYDNYQDNESLETDWGFACLVQYRGNDMLFDAGRRADLYEKNLELLQINPAEVPSLFISHEHGDHTSGMPWITSLNPSVKCYLPDSYLKEIRSQGKAPKNSMGLSKPEHLYGPFYSTGDDFQSFKEQGLIIKTEKGGVLLTGCGHPGAIEMVKNAKEELGIEVHTLIGGLHLMRSTDQELSDISGTLQRMGIRQICPTHCTGDHSIAFFEKSFGEGYIAGGTGKEIVIK